MAYDCHWCMSSLVRLDSGNINGGIYISSVFCASCNALWSHMTGTISRGYSFPCLVLTESNPATSAVHGRLWKGLPARVFGQMGSVGPSCTVNNPLWGWYWATTKPMLTSIVWCWPASVWLWPSISPQLHQAYHSTPVVILTHFNRYAINWLERSFALTYMH